MSKDVNSQLNLQDATVVTLDLIHEQSSSSVVHTSDSDLLCTSQL